LWLVAEAAALVLLIALAEAAEEPEGLERVQGLPLQQERITPSPSALVALVRLVVGLGETKEVLQYLAQSLPQAGVGVVGQFQAQTKVLVETAVLVAAALEKMQSQLLVVQEIPPL
jgi:hypothetical protein